MTLPSLEGGCWLQIKAWGGRAVALDHVAEVDRKIAELQAMADMLRHLVDDCRGDERPDCPILDHLAETPYANIAPSGATDGKELT